jgi:ABC-type xylose transport system permease subunit
MKKFFIELSKRFTAPTPSFFNRIKVFGGSLVACGTSLVAITGIPAKIAAIGGTLIWVGGAIVAVAQCAVTTSSSDIESK